ncbi:GGDEF domain-containing protein [Falsihalocynthiibacter arcticus]|uniref:diguanylate cyclase n=1 Tax=Falsihalocynthiibacter arcticus TaxID=1579316 RepID=A0A126V1Y9_9RHOB|nr:GGDEF domain-containing protein [Falsihalocynthiibacter arcticus]AML52290.1 hypothetical protein RC74_14315 [Falsihalocynthiibacter arcticus]
MNAGGSYYQKVANAYAGATVIVDLDGKIVAVNNAANEKFAFNLGDDFCASFMDPQAALLGLQESAAPNANHLFQIKLAGQETLAIFGTGVVPEPSQSFRGKPSVLLRLETQSALSSRFTSSPTDGLEDLNQRLRFEIERRLKLEMENATLEEKVKRDPKTSLLTRGGMDKALRAHVQETPDVPLIMIYLDLNGFKTINDNLGHDAGDLAIAEVGRILKENLRQDDIAARLGGDEFAVVLKGAQSRAQIQQFVLRLHDLICEPFDYTDPLTKQVHLIDLSFSAGVAKYPSDTKDVGLLTVFADRAMYSAKARGVPSENFTNIRPPRPQ